MYFLPSSQTRARKFANSLLPTNRIMRAWLSYLKAIGRPNDVLTVKWFMDKEHPINSAIGMLNPGGMVFIPAGTFNVSAAVTANKSDVHVLGAGLGATIIKTTAAGINAFELGDGTTTRDHISIRNLSIDTTVTKTAGYAVLSDKVNRLVLEDVFINSHFGGVHLKNTASVIQYLNRVHIRELVAATGIGILLEHGNDAYLSNILIDTAGSEPLAGIQIRESGGVWIDNCDILNSGIGLLIDPQSGKTVQWLFVTNSAFDNNDLDGIRIAPASGGTIEGLNFTGNWTSWNGQQGVNINPSGTGDGVRFVNHRSFNNTQHGVQLTGGINNSFDACDISGNSPASSGTYHGITVSGGVSRFAIRDCRIGQMAGLGNTQGRGIIVNAGASDNYVIQGNDLTLNVTEGINDGGTGTDKIVKDNLTGDSLDVASAATVTLPAHSDFFNITGTDNITSVVASWKQRRVTLKFAGILTFTDGSNLKLAGNLVTTADDTITLVCDGTDWYEVARSVN